MQSQQGLNALYQNYNNAGLDIARNTPSYSNYGYGDAYGGYFGGAPYGGISASGGLGGQFSVGYGF